MRSFSSIIIECLLIITKRKKRLANPVVFDKRIENLLAKGEQEYILKYKKFKIPVKKQTIGDMDYYILNPGGENKNKIMYFHGGGFVSQPIIAHWNFLNQISKNTDTEIWVPIYPKIPFHDAIYAYDHLLKLYARFVKVSKEGNIIFMGDSAGGNIVLSLAQQLKKINIKQASDLIMIAPYVDVTFLGEIGQKKLKKDAMLGVYGTKKCGELWAKNLDKKSPIISPFYGDLTGLGKMTLFTGTYDILNVEANRFHIKAKQAGAKIEFIQVDKMQHVYPLLPIREARSARKKMEEIINKKYD